MDKNIEKAKEYFLRGLEKYNIEDYSRAEEYFNLSLKISPNRVSILTNLSATQIKLKKLDEAKRHLEKILSLEPKNILALMNLANVYSESRQFDKAHHYLDLAIQNDRDNPELLCNKGSVFRFEGKLENALELYSIAIQKKNNYNFAKFNQAICQLSLENLDDGWANYEFRESKYDEEIPRVKRPPKNTTIDILSEQGIGDVIMFASLIPLLRDYKNINFYIDERLIESFSISFPKINFSSHANMNNHINKNYQIRIGSLAQFFLREMDDFKKINKPFLKPVDSKIKQTEKYIKKNKINIGVYWSSASKQLGKVTKIPLIDIIKKINVNDKNIISIQDGDHEKELNDVSTKLQISFTKVKSFNLKNDISHLAALISQCDLIISISSTVIHLAGAMGVPTIVLSQYSPDWRYFQSSNKVSWYSNTYLLKQHKLDDWDYPLSLLNDEIDKIIKIGKSNL